LQRSEVAFIAVQVLGGFYLVYLGIDAIRHSKVHAEDMVNQGEVFFAAILPQFLDRDSSNVTSQLVLMGATFSVLAFFSDGSWGLIAGTVRQWMATSPGRLVTMRRIGGVVMITLGIFTLASAL
jgi:threonine/homoserine/homoserine lactone efflux protein